MKTVGHIKSRRIKERRIKLLINSLSVITLIATTATMLFMGNLEAKEINAEQEYITNRARLVTAAGVNKAITNEVAIPSVVENESDVVGQGNIGEAYKIRTTGYCDHGYMKGGKWVYDGAIAGKEEWLGRKCNLYRVNKDGSVGELIGTYTFEDTGYGIDGSLVDGTSIDIWFPTEDEVWEFVSEYNDYTYIEWID